MAIFGKDQYPCFVCFIYLDIGSGPVKEIENYDKEREYAETTDA